MSFFQNPYVFGALIVLVTSILVYALQNTVDPDRADANKKLMYKTMAAGAVAVFALGWFIHRPEPLLSEPFPADG